MKKLLILLLFTSFGLKATQPEIFNYTTDDYIGHSINYSVTEDYLGMMYIANAYSVMEFDGINWRRIPVSNGQSPSCFAKNKEGKIFLGSFGDIGFLEKDQRGLTKFVSLKNKITESNKKIGVVYQAVSYKDEIYFCSFEAIYVYNGKTVSVIHPAMDENSNLAQFTYMTFSDDELLVYETMRGLGKISDGAFVKMSTNQSLEKQEFKAIFKDGGNYTLFEKHGLVKIQSGKVSQSPLYRNGLPEKAIITSAIALGNNRYAVGTEDSGILICDERGNILRSFDKKSGLNSNHVTYLYLNSMGELWAPLNNGIAVVKLNSSFEFINELQALEGLGYSSLLHHDTLYLGSSQGLYYCPNWSTNQNRSFIKTEGIGHKIYDLKLFNGVVLCSDEYEIYEINGNRGKRISDGTGMGAWVIKKVPDSDTLLIMGTYEDLRIYAFRKGHWVYKNTIKGFKESARMFEFDNKGVIWLVQGISGLFRIVLDKDMQKAVSVENYCPKYHFSIDYFNDIVKVNNQLKISSEGGVYYLGDNDNLIKDEAFSDLKVSITRIRAVEGDAQSLYLIQNERPVFIELQDGKYKVAAKSPNNLKDKLVGSAEYVVRLNAKEYIIATQQGFALYRPQSNKPLPKCLIRSIKLLNLEADSILPMNQNLPIALSYAYNNLAFYFSIPIYGTYNNVLYHTELSNKKLTWKDVSQNPFKEFTNLPEGDYTFKVWAEMNGTLSPAETMNFSIAPPWFRSRIAYVIYALLLIAAIYITTRVVRYRFNIQRKKLEEQKTRELQNKEAVHKTELLEIELQRKNDEMAFLALNYTQKKQFLTFLKSNLSQLSKNITDDQSANELKTLIRSIGVEDKEAENWEKFQMHFDKTNDNFFQKLKNLDPKMNESTMLMCSHIRMGKSNKEIADLLNISISGVEKRKYRLKEKLGIKDDNSITEFIAKL
ncbi:MAG: triple tyrosine motif-containing protein [Flavobacteriales bacterium]